MNRTKVTLFGIVLLTFNFRPVFGKIYQLNSPDGKINVNIKIDRQITWSASYENKPVILPGVISLTIDDQQVLGDQPKVISTKQKTIKQEIHPVVPTKFKTITDYCNELTIQFKGKYTLVFRAYDDGVAYRFITDIPKQIKVYGEETYFAFPDKSIVYFPEEKSFISHYERLYRITEIDSIAKDQFCSLPVLISTEDGIKVLVTEADLHDYPNMFLFGTGSHALIAGFPKVPLEIKPGRYAVRDMIITKEADYIAITDGCRSFPWRVFIITDDDCKLVESTLVFKLSRSLALEETAWIRTGKVAWDWWNAWNIYGVDFRAGINTETYKYYIDFASKYGIEYIILDEGWSNTTDLFDIIPEINLQEIILYGKEKNVGVILWTLWKPLDDNLDQALDQFAEWGAKGIKVDFMQLADQDMVNFYERIAREAAKRKLIVDFHGAFKPSGLRRAYPNVLTYEGVKGLENSKWSDLITPGHDVTLPFTRMVAGPMDYTPGAMVNALKNNFHPFFTRPMSQGTRCHQIAMYVVYESPLQMLADNPSNYLKEHECTDFIAKIPVTWDDTKVLNAKIGEYIVIARKKENTWYIGAMTDWEAREFELVFNFLEEGIYDIEIMEDGINADRYASDYKKITGEITRDSQMKIKLAKGGGWAAVISRKTGR